VVRQSEKGAETKKSGGGTVLNGAVGRKQRRGGSSGEDAMRRGAGVGPGPDRRAVPQPWPSRDADLFWAGARQGRLMHGPQLAAREGGRREAWAVHGPAWKKKVWADPEGTVMFGIFSNQFQTSSICFDQKVDLPNSKNSK
jgi:hypothetical protein